MQCFFLCVSVLFWVCVVGSLLEAAAGAAEAATRTSEAATTEVATTSEATTGTIEVAASALTVTLTVALGLLEHLEQLLRGEDRGELCAVLLLDVQTKLLLLNLLGLTGKNLIELGCCLFVGEVFLSALGILVTIRLSVGGCQFFEIALVDAFELGLLLTFKLQVLDETLSHTGLHFLAAGSTVIAVLCAYGSDGAEKEGDHCCDNDILFHCCFCFMVK